jgi:hypothetical protein
MGRYRSEGRNIMFDVSPDSQAVSLFLLEYYRGVQDVDTIIVNPIIRERVSDALSKLMVDDNDH